MDTRTTRRKRRATLARRCAAYGPLIAALALLTFCRYRTVGVTVIDQGGNTVSLVAQGANVNVVAQPMRGSITHVSLLHTVAGRHRASNTPVAFARWMPTPTSHQTTSYSGVASVPTYWFVVFAVVWAGALAFWRGYRLANSCTRCEYDLRGTPSATACPECGAAVEPAAGDGVPALHQPAT